jgi:4-hydroxy-2-oxoheptanedioate aldolase
VRARLERGDRLVGTFLQAPSAVSAELVGASGLDFACVEGEHSALGREAVERLVAACTLAGTPTLVRVRANTPVEIAAALDAGACGVIVPRVDSADEAASAARAARYPPRGDRGVGPGRATGYGRALAGYVERANDELAVGVQIESRQAVAAAVEIARVPEVDFVFVGPGDLAASLGVPFGDQRALDAIASVLAAASEAGRPAGIWAPSTEPALRWLEAGFQLVIVGSDLGFLAEGIDRAVSQLGRARG